MENKNVLAAVVLSTFVIMMWQFWYGEPVPQTQNQEQTQQQLKGDKPSAPSISQKKVETKLTRSDAINQSNRIKIENSAIVGSIALTGALIDLSLIHI